MDKLKPWVKETQYPELVKEAKTAIVFLEDGSLSDKINTFLATSALVALTWLDNDDGLMKLMCLVADTAEMKAYGGRVHPSD